MEERETSCTVVGNVDWYSHYGEQYGDSFKKLKIKLTYDWAIPLFSICPEKIIIPENTCTTMFIAALFIIARIWKQPKFPSTDELIKMWYIYTMDNYSVITVNETASFVEIWMGLTSISTEWSKPERKKQIYIYTHTHTHIHTCMHV